ncbi:polysaccharide biosynthesis tyrosine autokinase [Pacificoceanicola onchidii]|uniref:polysaccharide biosynthesis tyrosine autokinase n=1 Tax=Pacificoceanicola onchidii TaxID=2562685 RepID=UPI0010A68C85|nr:polysaccharide biosynthesis tyrosine autokinase [Pacificoceanicola onchidii]
MNTTFSAGRQTSIARGKGDAQDERVIDIRALLQVLWRGKLIILIAVVAAILIGGYYAYAVATPLYRSTAVVMLNNRDQEVLNLDSVMGGLSRDSSVVNTEVEVLRSRDLLGKVVDGMGLMEDPEFNTTLRPPGQVAQIKTFVKDLLGMTAAPKQVSEERANQFRRQVTIDTLRRAVSVRTVPDSLVFEVTITSEDGRKAARMADTLVDTYIRNQLEVKFDATEQATGWLTERVTELQAELEAAESRAKAFSTGTDLISPEALAATERQLKDLRDRIEDTGLRRAAAVEKQAALAAARTPEEQVAASGDSQLRAMLPRITQPAIAQAFEDRLAATRLRAAQDVTRIDNQMAALEASKAEFEARIEKQNEDLIALQQLTREAEASRLLYEHFLARLKETSAQQGIQQADSRMLSQAVIPVLPASPQKSRILMLSAFLGLLVGSLLVLLREAANDSFRSASMLERFSGYSVLGEVPRIPARRRKAVLTYLAEKPSSAAAESIRNLRTSVLLSNLDNPPQVLLVCSSIPGEGKTTVSMALAQNLAGMGKRVLLIEGDVRRRMLSAYFNIEKPKGLIGVLTEQHSLEEAVVTDEAIGIDVLFGEESRINAADVFASDKFAALLDEARGVYDQIIIDTPPVLVVPDARIVAQQVDGVIFVVKWDSTSKTLVSEALDMFESVNRPVSGLVLNSVSPRGMKRYGYGGKYSAYGRYGAGYHNN